MPVKFYTETVYQKYNYYAAWEPNKTIKLGDIGILNGYQFEYIDNLSNLGISFKVREDDNFGKLDFLSDREAQVSIKLSGQAPMEGMNLGEAEAGFQVDFKAKQAVLIKVAKAKTLVIENQIALGKEIEKRFNRAGADRTWDKDWVVVTEVVKGESGTVLVSKGQSASITVQAEASQEAGELSILDASMDFKVLSSRSIGAQAIAQQGITPLFKLKGIRKAFPWQSGRFKTRSARSTDTFVFDEIVPSGAEESSMEKKVEPSPFPVDAATTKSPRVWLFSVGINEYESEAIADLDGCIEDVEQFSKFLKKRLSIPKQQCKLIKNEEATRAGIIEHFRTHFSLLADGDIAVFHYSGHGSWEYTHPVFAKAGLDAKVGHNEVLLCHDSKMSGIHNLADKELRQLVAELQYPEGEASKDIHFVCLFDCCHSGSMLRQDRDLVKVRNVPGDEYGRPLDTYLDGYYAKQYEAKGIVSLPPVDYISLSACSPNQSAVELPTGGLFTQALIQTLESYGTSSFPSYAALYSLVYEMVKYQAYNDQTPYIEFSGKVNPMHSFLLQGEGQQSAYSLLSKRGEDWILAGGAIHGIPYSGWSKVDLPVFDRTLIKQVGTGQLKEVGLETSTLSLQFFESDSPSPDQALYVPISGRKLPIAIKSSWDMTAAKETLLYELAKQKNKERFELVNQSAYTLRITNEGVSIYLGDKLIFGLTEVNEKAYEILVERLSRMAHWEQINALQAPPWSMVNPKQIGLQLTHWNNDSIEVVNLIAPDEQLEKQAYEVMVEYNSVKKGRPYRIEVMNRSSADLYFYLVHLDRKYGIYQKHENYAQSIRSGEKRKLFDSISKRTGFGIGDKETHEIRDVFLLIASLEELRLPFQFAQDSLGREYGKVFNLESIKGPVPLREDIAADFALASWTIKRMEVRIRRD